MNRQKSIARKLNLFILIVCLLATSIQIKAQDDGLANNEFLIKNITKQQIKFYLRKGATSWGQPISLDSRKDRVFKDFDQIWIEGVHRTIKLTFRYYVEWDEINKTFLIIELKLRVSTKWAASLPFANYCRDFSLTTVST